VEVQILICQGKGPFLGVRVHPGGKERGTRVGSCPWPAGERREEGTRIPRAQGEALTG